MTENELKLWIEKMRDGNPDAFEVIYNQTKENVYRTVTFLVINKEDVHDVVNEVYMKMLKSISTYDLNRSFTKWLHGIVVHQVMDWRRNIWRRLRTIKRKKEMEVEELVDSYSSIIKREMKDELLTVLQRLSTKLRVVIVLRYYHDYSLEEIASILQIPLGTVKSRNHLALKELRRLYNVVPMNKEGISNVN